MVGINQKKKDCIASSVFQIFSIISVFSEKEWLKAIKNLNKSKNQNPILALVEKMALKLKQEI